MRLGDKDFLPQEISALILRELAGWADRALGERPERAVITVPAYFSDAQRNATREAGALAGLEVVRILNEPTAASLAYGYGDGSRHTVLVYDLGGGTFDVSVVTVEGDVTEVLASHGNNRLGGDDFDDLLAERLAAEFEKQHGVNLRAGTPGREGAAVVGGGGSQEEIELRAICQDPRGGAGHRGSFRPLHLEVEISRDEYEAMIRPLVESTLDSVSKALRDSGKRPGEMDAILLVGGSTRTPLVSGCSSRIRAWSRGRTCIRISPWRWAPGCWRRASPGAPWSACWWTFRRTLSASPISASAADIPIRTATGPLSGAIRRCL